MLPSRAQDNRRYKKAMARELNQDQTPSFFRSRGEVKPI